MLKSKKIKNFVIFLSLVVLMSSVLSFFVSASNASTFSAVGSGYLVSPYVTFDVAFFDSSGWGYNISTVLGDSSFTNNPGEEENFNKTFYTYPSMVLDVRYNSDINYFYNSSEYHSITTTYNFDFVWEYSNPSPFYTSLFLSSSDFYCYYDFSNPVYVSDDAGVGFLIDFDNLFNDSSSLIIDYTCSYSLMSSPDIFFSNSIDDGVAVNDFVAYDFLTAEHKVLYQDAKNNGDDFGVYVYDLDITISNLSLGYYNPSGGYGSSLFTINYRAAATSFVEDFQLRYEDLTGRRLIPDESVFEDYTSWIANAVSGFLEFEIFKGFSLGGLLMVIISFACVLWFLKLFAGG